MSQEQERLHVWLSHLPTDKILALTQKIEAVVGFKVEDLSSRIAQKEEHLILRSFACLDLLTEWLMENGDRTWL